MSDNLAAAIARANIRERASNIAQQSQAGNTDEETWVKLTSAEFSEYLDEWEKTPTKYQPDEVPSRVYVSWAGQNVRFWSAAPPAETPPADMPVTTYVVQSELDDVVACLARAFADPMRLVNSIEAMDETGAFLTKHGRLT